MDNAQTVLVVILSSFLALFLLLGIIATVKVIQILNHLKTITQKAESIADKAEAVSDFIHKSAGPMAIGRLLANLSEAVFSKTKNKRQSKGDEDA